jgi:superoxide dismutase, Cu-Zn family
MNKILVAVGLASVVALSAGVFAAHDTKADVRYTDTVGKGDTADVKGSVVIMTLPSGDVDVYFRMAGLKPNSGAYANHIHFNDAGDANCAAQNGDKVVPLENLMADANGMALVYTRISKDKLPKFPAGKTYVNVHANTPTAVGGSISCGDVLEIKLGVR